MNFDEVMLPMESKKEREEKGVKDIGFAVERGEEKKMSCYENLVMKTQMNYSRHYSTYASGGTAVVLSKQKPLSYEEQIQEFVRRVQEAECIVVGGASGLSAAGGGDFYYSDTPSFREHFGKFADKYGFKGAFSGMMHRFSTRNEHWGYVATF